MEIYLGNPQNMQNVQAVLTRDSSGSARFQNKYVTSFCKFWNWAMMKYISDKNIFDEESTVSELSTLFTYFEVVLWHKVNFEKNTIYPIF